MSTTLSTETLPCETINRLSIRLKPSRQETWERAPKRKKVSQEMHLTESERIFFYVHRPRIIPCILIGLVGFNEKFGFIKRVDKG